MEVLSNCFVCPFGVFYLNDKKLGAVRCRLPEQNKGFRTHNTASEPIVAVQYLLPGRPDQDILKPKPPTLLSGPNPGFYDLFFLETTYDMNPLFQIYKFNVILLAEQEV
jgi:hypothetical protein